jgi:hypothetical protein
MVTREEVLRQFISSLNYIKQRQPAFYEGIKNDCKTGQTHRAEIHVNEVTVVYPWEAPLLFFLKPLAEASYNSRQTSNIDTLKNWVLASGQGSFTENMDQPEINEAERFADDIIKKELCNMV